MENKPTFKNSLLSYFDSRKTGEDIPELNQEKLKAQPVNKIPNQITPNLIDEQSGNKNISQLGGSIDNLIKVLNSMSGSSSVFKNSITNNNTIRNNVTHKGSPSQETSNVTHKGSPSQETSNTRMDIFNNIHKTFKKNVLNNPTKNIKNAKEIAFTPIPKIIKSATTDKSEKFVENLISTNTLQNKINKISKDVVHKFTKINKPNRQYRATSASKRVPKIIDLTHMTENNKNVFKNLSNKMMTIVPSKTSSKILSSLINYKSNTTRNMESSTENYGNLNTTPKIIEKENYGNLNTTPKIIEKHIHTSIQKMNMNNVVGKEKYNLLNVPSLAEGGVVDKPTLAMIGEGGRSEEVRPLDRSNKSIDIQKTQTPTASSVAANSMNTNAALKMEQNNQGNAGGGANAPAVNVMNSQTTNPGKMTPPDSASFSHSPSKSLMAIQTQTHFPRWRRTMG